MNEYDANQVMDMLSDLQVASPNKRRAVCATLASNNDALLDQVWGVLYGPAENEDKFAGCVEWQMNTSFQFTFLLGVAELPTDDVIEHHIHREFERHMPVELTGNEKNTFHFFVNSLIQQMDWDLRDAKKVESPFVGKSDIVTEEFGDCEVAHPAEVEPTDFKGLPEKKIKEACQTMQDAPFTGMKMLDDIMFDPEIETQITFWAKKFGIPDNDMHAFVTWVSKLPMFPDEAK